MSQREALHFHRVLVLAASRPLRRLTLPQEPAAFLEPLSERAEAGLQAVATAAAAGELRVDDELHLSPIVADEEDPELVKLRAALDRRIGEAQLPQIILGVDAEVRFSWIMPGREPRSASELLIAARWDAIVHSASGGDPLYEAVAHLGQLLRTVFLADYFVNQAFRRELLRVLNRGEAGNALKRAIYSGRVAGYQAKHHEEMQAVADALSLLANIVMA